MENGHVEHKFYCSDGTTGELALINEFKGATVVVELMDANLVTVPPAPPSPIPNCAP